MFASAWNANREAEGDADPERFDITAERGAAKSLTFGAGPHFCMGANLARAELQEGLAFLAPRMPRPRAGRRARLRHDHRPLRDALAARALGRLSAHRQSAGLGKTCSSGYGPGAPGWSTGGGTVEGERRVFVARPPRRSLLLAALVACGRRGRWPSGGSAGERGRVARRARRRPARDDPHARRTASRTSWPRLRRPRLRLRLRRAPRTNICVLADTYVTVNARALALLRPRRAPTRRAATAPPTTTSTATSSTSASRTTARSRTCSRSSRRAARGPRSRRRVRGYVAGYNRYLRDTGVDNIADPRCRRRSRGCARSPRWTPTGASTSSA